MRGRCRVSNQDGMAVVGLALALSLFCVTAVLVPRSRAGFNNSVNRTSQYSTINSIRSNIQTTVLNDDSWDYMKADRANGSLYDCFQPPYPDCSGYSANLRLRNSVDDVYFDSLTSTQSGFNSDGRVCTTYNQSDSCLFQVDVVWTAQCTPGVPCIQPTGAVQIKIRLSERAVSSSGAIDTSPWSMTVNVD
jgi:hypothetical protein